MNISKSSLAITLPCPASLLSAFWNFKWSNILLTLCHSRAGPHETHTATCRTHSGKHCLCSEQVFKYFNGSSFTLDLLMKSPDGMTACVISADRENFKCSFKGTECLCYVTSRFSEECFCALTQNAKCLSMFGLSCMWCFRQT